MLSNTIKLLRVYKIVNKKRANARFILAIFPQYL